MKGIGGIMTNFTFCQYKGLIRNYFLNTYKRYPVPENSRYSRIRTFSTEYAMTQIMDIVEDLFFNMDFSLYCFPNQRVTYRYVIVDDTESDYGFSFGIEMSITDTTGHVKKETFMLLDQMAFMRTVMEIFYNKSYRIAG